VRADAVLLNKSPFGHKIYMIGSSERATRYSGVDTKRVLLGVYLLSSLLAVAAALVMMARFNSANAAYGESYLLVTILAAVLGGVNPFGGFGKVGGLLMALILLQMISSAFNLLNFSRFSPSRSGGADHRRLCADRGAREPRGLQAMSAWQSRRNNASASSACFRDTRTRQAKAGCSRLPGAATSRATRRNAAAATGSVWPARITRCTHWYRARCTRLPCGPPGASCRSLPTVMAQACRSRARRRRSSAPPGPACRPPGSAAARKPAARRTLSPGRTQG
jgi:hypothetical protein